MEYHSRANATKPKADPKSVSSSRTLAGQSGDRKRKREGGENGDHQRKGGDRSQQQAAGRAANVEDKARRGVRADEPATSRTSARPGEPATSMTSARPGEPATSRTSARQGGPATSLTVLLPADATATTTTHSSPRRVASRGMHLSVTVSIGRKACLFARRFN